MTDQDDIRQLQMAVIRLEEGRQRLDHLREVLDLRLAAAERALDLQATVYDEHLDRLNHAAERLDTMQAKCVQTDVYRVQHAAIEAKIDMIQRLVFIGVGVVAALQFALHYFTK